jgi:hypothetical protein
MKSEEEVRRRKSQKQKSEEELSRQTLKTLFYVV